VISASRSSSLSLLHFHLRPPQLSSGMRHLSHLVSTPPPSLPADTPCAPGPILHHLGAEHARFVGTCRYTHKSTFSLRQGSRGVGCRVRPCTATGTRHDRNEQWQRSQGPRNLRNGTYLKRQRHRHRYRYKRTYKMIQAYISKSQLQTYLPQSFVSHISRDSGTDADTDAVQTPCLNHAPFLIN